MLTGSRERLCRRTSCHIVCNSLDIFRILKSQRRSLFHRSVAGIHKLSPLCLLPPTVRLIAFHNFLRLQDWSQAALKRRRFLPFLRPQTEPLETASKGKNLPEHSVRKRKHAQTNKEMLKKAMIWKVVALSTYINRSSIIPLYCEHLIIFITVWEAGSISLTITCFSASVSHKSGYAAREWC